MWTDSNPDDPNLRTEFARSRFEQELAARKLIGNVSTTQGLVQRVFGVGKIQLTGSDRTHPSLSMIGIADVKRVSDLIDDIRRKGRRRRQSLHIESI